MFTSFSFIIWQFSLYFYKLFVCKTFIFPQHFPFFIWFRSLIFRDFFWFLFLWRIINDDILLLVFFFECRISFRFRNLMFMFIYFRLLLPLNLMRIWYFNIFLDIRSFFIKTFSNITFFRIFLFLRFNKLVIIALSISIIKFRNEVFIIQYTHLETFFYRWLSDILSFFHLHLFLKLSEVYFSIFRNRSFILV